MRQSFYQFSLFVILIACLSSCQKKIKGRFIIHVIDGSTGKPVPNIPVEIIFDSKGYTDEEGKAVFELDSKSQAYTSAFYGRLSYDFYYPQSNTSPYYSGWEVLNKKSLFFNNVIREGTFEIVKKTLVPIYFKPLDNSQSKYITNVEMVFIHEREKELTDVRVWKGMSVNYTPNFFETKEFYYSSAYFQHTVLSGKNRVKYKLRFQDGSSSIGEFVKNYATDNNPTDTVYYAY